MLNFVRRAFRGGLEVILWINLIVWTICGGIAGNALSSIDNYIVLGLILGIIMGLSINIIGGGLIATILNIDGNVEKLVRGNLSTLSDEGSNGESATKENIKSILPFKDALTKKIESVIERKDI